MKKTFYAIALNMISLAVMAQTTPQPIERVETSKPTTGHQDGKDGIKMEAPHQEQLRNANPPVEEPAQVKSDDAPEPIVVDENIEFLVKDSQSVASKSQRAANGRRPLPIRISIGALMLSANH